MTFKQVIRDKTSKDIYVTAEVSVVAVSGEGKLYIKIPSVLSDVINEGLLCKD